MMLDRVARALIEPFRLSWHSPWSLAASVWVRHLRSRTKTHFFLAFFLYFLLLLCCSAANMYSSCLLFCVYASPAAFARCPMHILGFP